MEIRWPHIILWESIGNWINIWRLHPNCSTTIYNFLIFVQASITDSCFGSEELLLGIKFTFSRHFALQFWRKCWEFSDDKGVNLKKYALFSWENKNHPGKRNRFRLSVGGIILFMWMVHIFFFVFFGQLIFWVTGWFERHSCNLSV